jgi:hypothetical protein
VSEPIAIVCSRISIPIRSRTDTRKREIGAIGNKEAFAGPASRASVGPQFNEARSLQIWQMSSLFESVVGAVGEGSESAEFASKCRPDVGIGICAGKSATNEYGVGVFARIEADIWALGENGVGVIAWMIPMPREGTVVTASLRRGGRSHRAHARSRQQKCQAHHGHLLLAIRSSGQPRDGAVGRGKTRRLPPTAILWGTKKRSLKGKGESSLVSQGANHIFAACVGAAKLAGLRNDNAVAPFLDVPGVRTCGERRARGYQNQHHGSDHRFHFRSPFKAARCALA